MTRPTRMRATGGLEDLMVGLTIFFIGLVKKTVLADGVASYATSVFHSASSGFRVDFFSGWSGVLAYTRQLYFDFSGYSDMTIGFLRDYLYIGLGGNQCGDTWR
jgi:alginate O-acetyltransferase complex protein AlgI